MRFCVLAAVSWSQSCESLSWCAIHLPSGEGTASHRSTLPSCVICSPAPMPLAGIFQYSNSPLSLETTSRLFPSGMNTAFRNRPGLRSAPSPHQPPLRRRRDFHVASLVLRVLLQPLAVLVHRPQVHGAVAVRKKINAAVPPHRILARAGILRGQRRGFLAFRVLPEVLRGAAFV